MPSKPEVSFETACALTQSILSGHHRRTIAATMADAPTLNAALRRLRETLTANAFDVDGRRVSLDRIVKTYDRDTRAEGFHVLHDWDGKSDRVNENSIPVDVLDYLIRQRGGDTPDATIVAVLIDYYFVHVLELLALRAWDEGDADANLDRIGNLLALLQSSDGSGQTFANSVETLILLATSHFELHERGYALLLERVRTLNAAHRLLIAIGHAASMGSHLRFGFEASYARDTIFMRDDNVADYPWLCFALVTIMRELDSTRTRTRHQHPHPAPSTRHPAPSTWHPAPSTSTQHPAPSTKHPACRISPQRPLGRRARVYRRATGVAVERRARAFRISRSLSRLTRRLAGGLRAISSVGAGGTHRCRFSSTSRTTSGREP